MADTPSTLELSSRLNRQIDGILAALDIDLVGRETSKVLQSIKQLTRDSRLDVRDWEMAQNRAEMTANAKIAAKRFAELRQNILAASEHGIFSAIDVIDISAQLDTILAELA